VVVPSLAIATLTLVGVVTSEVVIGFVVVHTRVVSQLLDHAGIVQLVAVRVPDGPGRVVNVLFVEYPVPTLFVAYHL